MIIEFILLIWCIAITVLLGTVIHCQNNQSDILKLLNNEICNLKQHILPPHINARCTTELNCPKTEKEVEE